MTDYDQLVKRFKIDLKYSKAFKLLLVLDQTKHTSFHSNFFWANNKIKPKIHYILFANMINFFFHFLFDFFIYLFIFVDVAKTLLWLWYRYVFLHFSGAASVTSAHIFSVVPFFPLFYYWWHLLRERSLNVEYKIRQIWNFVWHLKNENTNVS